MQNNKNIDKVNMSLDDIIKLNRNQGRQNKFAANRSLNNNKNNNNFNNGNKNNNNKKRNNNFKQQQQPQNRQNVQQRVNNKPYGLLNKSKLIQKRNINRNQNVIILKTQQQGGQQQFQTGRKFPRNLNNRRRRLQNVNGAPQRLFNRFGTANGNKNQNGQKPTMNKRNNQQQPIRVNKFVNKPVLNRIQQVRQRKTQQLRQPLKSAKIAMQSARKNVMKAKRLLATKTARKGPIQQIMTQRYAKSLGLVQKTGGQIRRNNIVKSVNKAKIQRPSNKMLTININNRVNKTNRVKQVQKQRLQKSVQLVKQQFKKPQGQQATKRPILNRNRPQQGQQQSSGGARKVFF